MAVGLQPQLRSQIRALRHHAEPCRKRLQSAELTGQRRGRFDRLWRKTLERSTQIPGRALPGGAVLGGVQDERQHSGGRAWHAHPSARKLEPFGIREQPLENLVRAEP